MAFQQDHLTESDGTAMSGLGKTLPPHHNDPPRDDPSQDKPDDHHKGPQLSADQLEALATQVTQSVLKQLGNLTQADITTGSRKVPSGASSSSGSGGEHSYLVASIAV